MNEPKIPVFLAVGLWTASALAVLSFTYIAYKQTASGVVEQFVAQGGVDPTLVAASGLLNSELTPQKRLTRGKFTPSR